MDKFIHSPLDLDRPAIRLLQLFQGSGPDIECELFQAYLDDEHDDLIPYEALSYTWGGITMDASIKIHSKDHDVTENLFQALQHLRLPDRDRILWVDAVCIDQSNMIERGHQVEQMGSVYSRAHRVLVWLGTGTDDTAVLLDTLGQLQKFGMRSWNLEDPRWPAAWSALEQTWEKLHPGLQERQKRGLQALLSHPWFKRVWILQEVANARRATIHVDGNSMPAQMLALAPRLIDLRPESHCQAVLDILPGQAREHSWWSKKRDLYTLLRRFSSSEASEPRDKIYALLGICSDGRSIQPDYTKDFSQLIHELAIFFFDLPARADHYTLSDVIPCEIEQELRPLDNVVQCKNTNWVDAYVRSRPKDRIPSITSEVLTGSLKNTLWGKEVVESLIEHPEVHVFVSRPLLLAAMTNGGQTLALLHERCFEAAVACAAKFEEICVNFLLKVLDSGKLRAVADDLKTLVAFLVPDIDEHAIVARLLQLIGNNVEYGVGLAALIFSHWENFFEVMQRTADNLASPVITHHRWEDLLDLLKWPRTLRIFKRVYETVKRIPCKHRAESVTLDHTGWQELRHIMKFILDEVEEICADGESKIDAGQHIYEMLSDPFSWDVQVLTLLLEYRGPEVMITEEVLITALFTDGHSSGLFQEVLRCRQIQSMKRVSDLEMEMEVPQCLLKKEEYHPHPLTPGVIYGLTRTFGLGARLLYLQSEQELRNLGVSTGGLSAVKYVVRALARIVWRQTRFTMNRIRFLGQSQEQNEEKIKRFNSADLTYIFQAEESIDLVFYRELWGREEWYSEFDCEWEPWLSEDIVPATDKWWGRAILDIEGWHGNEDTVYTSWKAFSKSVYSVFRGDKA